MGFGTGFLLEILHTCREKMLPSMSDGIFSVAESVAEFNLTLVVDLLQLLQLAIGVSFHLP